MSHETLAQDRTWVLTLTQCQQPEPTTAPGLLEEAFQDPGNTGGPRTGLLSTDPFLPEPGSPQHTGSISPPQHCQQKDRSQAEHGTPSLHSLFRSDWTALWLPTRRLPPLPLLLLIGPGLTMGS